MFEKIPKAVWQIGIIVAIIVSIMVCSVVWAGMSVVERSKVCISPEMVKELCVANGIELRKCKVKKPYVVLPKGSS